MGTISKDWWSSISYFHSKSYSSRIRLKHLQLCLVGNGRWYHSWWLNFPSFYVLGWCIHPQIVSNRLYCTRFPDALIELSFINKFTYQNFILFQDFTVSIQFFKIKFHFSILLSKAPKMKNLKIYLFVTIYSCPLNFSIYNSI